MGRIDLVRFHNRTHAYTCLSRLSGRQTCQGVRECFRVPVVRGETESYKCLFLNYKDGAQHNPLYEAVHCKGLDLSIGESLRLKTVCGHIRRSIQKQPEHIGPERTARHSVGSEVLQVFYP